MRACGPAMGAAAAAIGALLLCAGGAAAQKAPLTSQKPWIIGHRGEPGVYPEHTIAGYDFAIANGADFFECDIVLTSDCGMVCRHEPLLSNTTNADDIFPDRKRNYTIDYIEYSGIFAIDLTMEEVGRLRARQALYFRDQQYNDKFAIPTFEEYLSVARAANRVVGVTPEIKHPTWHRNQNLTCLEGTTFTRMVLETMAAYGYNASLGTPEWRENPAILQSFETENLKEAATISLVPTVALLDEGDYLTPDTGVTYASLMEQEGLEYIAEFSQAIGPWKVEILQATNDSFPGYQLIERAHDLGLIVLSYTFRNEKQYYEPYFPSPAAEIEFFTDLQLDGAFTDYASFWASYFGRNPADGPAGAPSAEAPAAPTSAGRKLLRGA